MGKFYKITQQVLKFKYLGYLIPDYGRYTEINFKTNISKHYYQKQKYERQCYSSSSFEIWQ